METETLNFVDELRNWRPEVFPGTGGGGTAITSTFGGFGSGFGRRFGYTVTVVVGTVGGCTCPVQTAWPGTLVFDVDCPVHTPEVRNQWRRFFASGLR